MPLGGANLRRMDPIVLAAIIGVGGTVIVGVAGFWASVRNTSKNTAVALRAVELAALSSNVVRLKIRLRSTQVGARRWLDEHLCGCRRNNQLS